MRGFMAALEALLVGGVIATAATVPAEAKETNEFTIGQWTGLVFNDDDSGQFVDCTAWAFNRDNIQIGISVNKSWNLELWLNSKTWNLPENQSYPISFWIDRNRQYSSRATTYSGKYVTIAVERDQEVFDQLENGSQVTFRTQDEDYVFDLSGSRAALNRLLDCVDRNTKQASANPFGGGSGGQPNGAEPETQQNNSQNASQDQSSAAVPGNSSTKLKELTAGSDQVRQYLIEVTGAKPSMITINTKSTKQGYPYYQFSTPIGQGQFWQEYQGQDALRDVVADYFRGYKDECKGEFEQDIQDPVQGEHGQMMFGTAACSNSPYQDNGAEVLSYALIAAKDVISVYVTYNGGNAAKAKTDSLGKLIAKRQKADVQ